jgi:outer membrane protein TolC
MHMALRFALLPAVLGGALVIVAGCRARQPFYFGEDGDLSHYVDKATTIAYPDAETYSLDDVNGATEPLTLENPDPDEIWEMTLQEAVHIALANSKVIRQLPAPGMSPRVLSNPSMAATVYDPALQETSNGGLRPIGVEAALADFDATFDALVRWDKRDTPQNVAEAIAFFRPDTFLQELGSFQAQLRKTTATGGSWYLRHNVGYDWSNTPSAALRFPSAWDVSLEAEFSQPLLQGAGVGFTRIFGPRPTSVVGSVAPLAANRAPEQYRGVMIARINADITLADFEAQVRNLLRDVESGYWDLYVAYRNLAATTEGRDKALETWRKVRVELEVGAGKAIDEAQARNQYFVFRAAVEESLTALYSAERRLRYVIGLAPTDGRLIRPAEEPTTAEILCDWQNVRTEALVRSVDLRKQKWQIKRRELELIAARNLLLPELNAGGVYRWVGLGDELIDPDNRISNAYGDMTHGDHQQWSLGLNLSVPLGFRKAMAGVRNAELALARERAVLQDQELALMLDLSEALARMDRHHHLAQTRFNQLVAAQTELAAWEAREQEGLPIRDAALDRKLEAQRRVTEADVTYHTALADYNKAVAEMHYHKGSLLEYDGVYLAEGPWPAKAYFDALRRARARDAGLYLDYGLNRPGTVSRGEHAQRFDTHASEALRAPNDGEDVPPEAIPAPQPEPLPLEGAGLPGDAVGASRWRDHGDDRQREAGLDPRAPDAGADPQRSAEPVSHRLPPVAPSQPTTSARPREEGEHPSTNRLPLRSGERNVATRGTSRTAPGGVRLAAFNEPMDPSETPRTSPGERELGGPADITFKDPLLPFDVRRTNGEEALGTGAPTALPDPCEDVELRPIGQITHQISAEGEVFPKECPMVKRPLPSRLKQGWQPITFTWKASALCHRPLYFEEANLERYGYLWCDGRCYGIPAGLVQPVLSGAHFFLTVPVLPYKMGLYPPNECVYTLGYYRPGSCAPYILDPLPLSVRAALMEGAVWTGMPILIP